ncbi:MAG: dipeptidase [Pseudomonadota bacterium]|nr:dipeptidase [Pseudomonadota bacterium]
MSDPVLAHLARERDAVLARLCDYVRIPSVSTDPAYEPAIRAAQDHLLRWLAAIGLSGVRILEGPGHRPVYGEWLGAPGRLTVLVYGHYDVQPPDPLERWTTPPFEPSIRDGQLHARGASDDKGPTAIAIETIAGFLAVEGKLPVNVKLLFEGEEEVGSRTLAEVVEANRELLAADVVLSADGARWRADLPSINIGSRGNAGFEFGIRTAAKDLHSGRYGGAVPNPLHVMAELVASLHDASGRIAVPGFYDGVAEAGDDERAAIATLPFDEAAWLSGIGAAAFGEAGYSTLERLWLRPTLEVNGMWGGYTGAGSKTVIPHEAFAKLTMRLVPGQEPGRVRQAVIDHLRARCPEGVAFEVRDIRGAAKAYVVPGDHPALAAAEATIAEVAGRAPVRVKIGATLPINDIFDRILGLDTVMFSFATSDEDYHAPNEFFRLSALDEGLRAWTLLLRRLGGHDPADYAAFRRK